MAMGIGGCTPGIDFDMKGPFPHDRQQRPVLIAPKAATV
jgi:hypothetical protein